MKSNPAKKTALLSVYDKEGIVVFASELLDLGWNIVSSGGTAKVLKEAGIPVTDVAEISKLPAILDHRVVTLVPHIHGGLLATEEMLDELKELGFPWIDLVCIDLYPLKEEIAKPEATRKSVIDKTDIGGPTLMRSAAKGERIVIVDPNDRMKVIEWLKAGQPKKDEFKRGLGAKAEGIVADYCLSSARFHSDGKIDGMVGTEIASCAYGENAWQADAGLFEVETSDPLSLPHFELVEGETPSYNNWCDYDRLLQTITHIKAALELNKKSIPFVAVGCKHGNPCGVAVGYNKIDVLKRMLSGDIVAIFGGIVMTNFPIDCEEAECLRRWRVNKNTKRILDGVLAPDFTYGAMQELARKGGKCRMLKNPALLTLGVHSLDNTNRFRYVRGGFLKQPNYSYVLDLSGCETTGTVSDAIETNMLLAWAIGSTSNSNTISIVKDGMLIGNGVGQQDRVGAAELAISKAHRTHTAVGSVAYSDSFFPFDDGPLKLIENGVKAIIATKGSIRDDDIRDACRRNNTILYLIDDKVARGFFGH
jgi:phosphoribosylaminoimidazolecarboxamide formyltransferase / IMP cyclohydrolase